MHTALICSTSSFVFLFSELSINSCRKALRFAFCVSEPMISFHSKASLIFCSLPCKNCHSALHLLRPVTITLALNFGSQPFSLSSFSPSSSFPTVVLVQFPSKQQACPSKLSSALFWAHLDCLASCPSLQLKTCSPSLPPFLCIAHLCLHCFKVCSVLFFLLAF